jgi:cytochrome c oxidase assembly factor CtaG
MQWWCSAQGVAWTWKWQAYPGVWLMVLVIAAGYYFLTRNAPPEARRDRIFGWLGVAIIWIALDWPIGPLAAGYLASVHALQFLLLTFIAAPLVLIGLRKGGAQYIPTTGKSGALLRLFTTPVLAVFIFNSVTIATHTSFVVDSLMVSQIGAFATDFAWFVSAILFWWPVIVDIPERPRFTGLFHILYLFLGTSFHTVIAIIMLISDYPLYGVYELAPPMTGLTALQDLHLAGGVMELIGAAIIFPIMSVIFFRWAKTSEEGGPTFPVNDPRVRPTMTNPSESDSTLIVPPLPK